MGHLESMIQWDPIATNITYKHNMCLHLLQSIIMCVLVLVPFVPCVMRCAGAVKSIQAAKALLVGKVPRVSASVGGTLRRLHTTA